MREDYFNLIRDYYEAKMKEIDANLANAKNQDEKIKACRDYFLMGSFIQEYPADKLASCDLALLAELWPHMKPVIDNLLETCEDPACFNAMVLSGSLRHLKGD